MPERITVEGWIKTLWKLREIRAHYETLGYTRRMNLDESIDDIERIIEWYWNGQVAPWPQREAL